MKKPQLIVIALVIITLVIHFLINRGDSNVVPHAEIQSELAEQKIQYTSHAKCRMACRYIDKKEIKQILSEGTINWKKSDEGDKPCPSYAIEGQSDDGQTIRIVVADCQSTTRVITVIDLKNDYECDCR